MKIGDKIKMDGERQRYTVTACDGKFAIMVKPFNAKKTYLYTITDTERGVRGPCNLVFGLPCDVDQPDAAVEALAMLQSGEMAVSYRRCLPLTESEMRQLRPAQ